MYAYTCCRCTNCAAQIVLEEQSGSNTSFADRLGHARAVKPVHTVERCSCPKRITSQKMKRLFYSEPEQNPCLE